MTTWEDCLHTVHSIGKQEREKMDLVHFHNTAATSEAAVYGAPAIVWQALADNFHTTAPFVGHTMSEHHYRRLRFITEQRYWLPRLALTRSSGSGKPSAFRQGDNAAPHNGDGSP